MEGGRDYKELRRNSGVNGNAILAVVINTYIKVDQVIHFKYEQFSTSIKLGETIKEEIYYFNFLVKWSVILSKNSVCFP